MKIFVVIPNWNGEDMLAKCLESLEAQTKKATIVVVDNKSIDKSVKIVQDKFKGVILLRNPKNLGFAGGVNVGIRYAAEHGADAVALLNNDAVADKHWLKELASELENHPQSGIVTCKLMRSDQERLDSTGDFYSVSGIPFPRGRNQLDGPAFDTAGNVFGASGGASLYRAELFKQIGLFDEKFFAYYEDVDMSFRAQLAGWQIRYTPRAVAYHDVGATSSKLGDFTRYHSIKNFLLLYTKTMPTKLYWKYLPIFLYQFLRTTARSIIDRKPHVWLKAVLSFINFLPEVLSDRRKIQKSRKVSLDYIDSILYKSRPPKIPPI
jgi:GT2 family glycosyltransferase